MSMLEDYNEEFWAMIEVGLQLNALIKQAVFPLILTLTHLLVLFNVNLLIAYAVIVFNYKSWAVVKVGLLSNTLINIFSMIYKLYLSLLLIRSR